MKTNSSTLQQLYVHGDARQGFNRRMAKLMIRMFFNGSSLTGDTIWSRIIG